jgi:hypothetical protein
MVRLKNVGVEETAEETAPVATQEAPVEVTSESNGNGEAETETNGGNLEVQRKHYAKLVGQIGGEYGTGKKALVNLAKTVVEGAAEQVIKANAKASTSKDGKKKLDDAATLYGRFRAGASKKAGEAVDAELAANANDGSWKAQVSKLRALIKFGNEYRDDASQIVEDAIAVHTSLLGEAGSRKALKLTSTYSALVAVAREQLKEDRKGVAMNSDELRELFLGEEKAPKTGADLVESAMATLRRAQKGKDATDSVEGRDPVEDQGVEDAIQALRGVMSRIAPERWAEMQAAEEKAAAEASETAEETEEVEAE